MKKYFGALSLITTALSSVILPSQLLAGNNPAKGNIDRSLKSYTKYVERAEQESCNTEKEKAIKSLQRSCERELQGLDRRYDKYTDDIKNDPSIMAVRERHLKLNETLTDLNELVALDEIITPYSRKISSLEKEICTRDNSVEWSICFDQLEVAEKIYLRIPEEQRAVPQIVDLRKRHAALIEAQEEMKAIAEDRWKNELNSAAAYSDFKTEGKNLINELLVLELGKSKSPTKFLHDIKTLDEKMPQIEEFATNCVERYSDAATKDEASKEWCDLALNRITYRNQVVVASYLRMLEVSIAEGNEEIDKFIDNGYLETSILNRYTHEFTEYYNEIAGEVTRAIEQAGGEVPSFSELESVKPRFAEALTQVLKKNSWKQSDYSDVPSALEELAGKNAQKRGLKLKASGLVDDHWVINKNVYGIPLSKSAEGYLLLKHHDESFCRKQYAYFIRTYDGNDFVPASSVNIVSTTSPMPCK